MRKRQLMIVLVGLFLCLNVSACQDEQTAVTVPPVSPQPEIEFSPDGTALLSIPSLNGNLIAIRLVKPEGDGPFPVLIGIPGADGMFGIDPELEAGLVDMGVMAVDFAPQGRGDSEGEDNYNGEVHQDDLKALVDFVSSLSYIQEDNIGILTYSYGIVMATGALSRYPEMPVAFLIDWEGPACPGRDLQRGLENHEPWAEAIVFKLSGKLEMSPEEYSELQIHGGSISDEAYWQERDAARFIKDLPCPYVRVQFDTDHALGPYKHHMVELINAATENSGQWTRCNDNPANIIYAEDELSGYHFHRYSEGEVVGFNSAASKSVNDVLLAYIEEMLFSKPYEAQ
jgi:hypothetical protein